MTVFPGFYVLVLNSYELKTIKETAKIKSGDLFIQGGFPGHAVIVVDVAVHIKTGKKIVLLAQSFMPAQNIHVLKNLTNQVLDPWYVMDFGQKLEPPEWTFKREHLKRFQ